MRCILVSNANLKADTLCTDCRKKIADSYVRAVGNRFIYCSYNCYENATEAEKFARNFPVATWTVNS